MHIDEDDRDLSKLSAAELAVRLRDHVNAISGLAGEIDWEIARELVRRARRAERLEGALRKIRRRRRSA